MNISIIFNLKKRKKITFFMVFTMILTTTSLSSFPYVLKHNFNEKNFERQINNLIKKMTLAEKIGQMTQANKLSIDENFNDIKDLFLGSLLNGGNGVPKENNPNVWLKMTESYQKEALKTRLKIPLLYGVDAVHGHALVRGAVAFPQNIGLGATQDPDLLSTIGKITGMEVAATGIHWDFAPAVSIPRDLRWGRTYEGYSENTELVSLLSKAYIEGLQMISPLRRSYQVIGTAKHYLGDGGTVWGTSSNPEFIIDQGNTPITEEILRKVHLRPYYSAIDANVQTIMVSYSRWKNTTMHSHKYLITDVLKKELGFDGIVISDWLGVFWQPGDDIALKIEKSINAGIDIVMAAEEYKIFIKTLTKLVQEGRVSMDRINDSVRRILRVKFRYGLFDQPFGNIYPIDIIGRDEHYAVARKAVQKSAVLLKNKKTLPLSGKNKKILLVGQGGHNLGLQSGGWTLIWQGHKTNEMLGTTLLQGLKNQLPSGWSINYQEELPSGSIPDSDYTIIVSSEDPYAEGFGDKEYPALSKKDLKTIDRLSSHPSKKILVIFSGRPIEFNRREKKIDSIVAAWLPGSAGGDGLADLLYGKVNFSGKLSYTWPWSFKKYKGYPIPFYNIQFPFGFGLKYKQ